MTRYQYSARIVPVGRPVVMPMKGGGRERMTFTEESFSIERESRRPIRLLLEHDVLMQIGNVGRVRRQGEWFVADFELQPEITEVLHVGQPVSPGLSVFNSGGTYISELSVVSHGAIAGAEITSRRALLPRQPEPKPPAKLAAAVPTGSDRTGSAGDVFYGGPLIRRNVGRVLSVTEGGVTTVFAER